MSQFPFLFSTNIFLTQFLISIFCRRLHSNCRFFPRRQPLLTPSTPQTSIDSFHSLDFVVDEMLKKLQNDQCAPNFFESIIKMVFNHNHTTVRCHPSELFLVFRDSKFIWFIPFLLKKVKMRKAGEMILFCESNNDKLVLTSNHIGIMGGRGSWVCCTYMNESLSFVIL